MMKLGDKRGTRSASVNFFRVSLLFESVLIKDEPFLGFSKKGAGQKGLLPKICHTYLTKTKLGTVIPYLKKIQNHATHFLSSAGSSIFSPEISNFCYIKKHKYMLYFNA